MCADFFTLPSIRPMLRCASSSAKGTCTATQMWRDIRTWALIERDIVPTLADMPSVRCWSAGCANGAEPYTLAALFDDVLPDAEVSIDATDINPDMIREAQSSELPA